MKKNLIISAISLLLLIIYYFAYSKIVHTYPVPHISWDSNYYIRAAFQYDYALRPSGYPYFLQLISYYSPSLKCIVMAQFLLHYCAVIFFLFSLQKTLNFPILVHALLGLAFVLEPVALYHSNSILSDQLFSSLTLIALASLLLYIHNKKYIWFIIHVVAVFCCIEVRHIGLFYPFFTCFVLIVYASNRRLIIINVLLILLSYFALSKWHINQNIQKYSAPVYSPFAGWTNANNALYCNWYADINLDKIEDKEIRDFQKFITHSLDSTGYVEHQVGSGYLWNEQSPLNIMRNKVMDSLTQHYNHNKSWYVSWYILAPLYAKYGTYFQIHYPYAYIKGYMVPNVQTMLCPHLGEMADYSKPAVNDSLVLKRYDLKEGEINYTSQLYKDTVAPAIERGYLILLGLFIISVLLFIFLQRDIDKNSRRAAFIMLVFVFLFYAATLYSSWFMYRYLLPAYIIIMAFIAIVANHCLDNARRWVNGAFVKKSR